MAEPLAVADGQTAGLRAEILELKRGSGDSVTLKFAIVNDTSREFSNTCGFRESSGETCGPVSGVHLLDPVNNRKHLVLRDSNNACVCADMQAIKPGERLLLWAKFPAPPEGVDRMSVVIPNFLPADDVPLG